MYITCIINVNVKSFSSLLAPSYEPCLFQPCLNQYRSKTEYDWHILSYSHGARWSDWTAAFWRKRSPTFLKTKWMLNHVVVINSCASTHRRFLSFRSTHVGLEKYLPSTFRLQFYPCWKNLALNWKNVGLGSTLRGCCYQHWTSAPVRQQNDALHSWKR